MDILCELNEKGKTIILVTHDPKILEYAHRIVELEDGRIAT
jgi:ABC-type lipoprotein export system ATPase subunit